MGPVWYLTRADLRTSRLRTAGIVVIVALVGGAVIMLTAGVFRTLSAPDRYSANVGSGYDLSLEQFSGRPRAQEIEALPAVAAVETATFVFGGLLGPDGDGPTDGLVFAGSANAFGGRLVEGREPSQAGEFVATRSWAAAAGTEIGDRLTLVTITQEQADERGFDVAAPEGPTLKATMVGLIEGPNELQDPYPITLFPAALLDEGGVGDVGISATVGVVALSEGSTSRDLRSQLSDLPGTFGLKRLEWVPDEVRSAVNTHGQGLAVVTVVVGIAAIAVLGQLLARRTRRAPTQHLVMRSIGLLRRQIVAERVGAAAVPIVLGCAVAGVLAFLASAVFPYGFPATVEPDPGVRLDPLVHGLGPVVLAGVLIGWVTLSELLGAHVPRRSRVTTGPLVGWLGSGPAATGTRFAITRPGNDVVVRTPIVGLALVLAALVAAMTFGANLDRFLEEPARYGSNFDFATGAGSDAVPAELRTLLEQDPDVVGLTLFGTELANVGDVALEVTAMDPIRGSLEPEVLSGRLARGREEITLGAVASRRLGADVGDELVLAGEGGQHRFFVTGIAVVPSVEGGDGVGEGAVTSIDGLRRIAPDAGLGVAAVRIRPGADVASRIEDATGIAVGLPDPPPAVLNMGRVKSTPYIVAGCLAALTVLSLGHQLVSTARRRRRDLAVLRALGADRRWVTEVLHWHAVVVAAAMAVVAGPLGVATGRAVYSTYIDRVGARTDASVPLLLLALGLVALLITANAVAAIPARRARHDVPGRVLAGE